MRPEKKLLLDKIKEQIEHFDSFIIMKYLALNATLNAKFRDKIAALGGDVECVKKRIFVKACEACNIKLNIEDLTGHIGLIFSGKEAIQTAKAVFELRKDSDKAIEVLGGHLDGQLISAEKIEILSKLPGKDEMRAQLLSVFAAPLAQTLATMESLMCSILYCLDGKAKEDK